MEIFSTIVACIAWIFAAIKVFKLIYFRNINRNSISKIQDEAKKCKFSRVINIIFYTILTLLVIILVVLAGTIIFSHFEGSDLINIKLFYDAEYRAKIELTNPFFYKMALYTGIAIKSLVYSGLLCMLVKHIYMDIKMFFKRKEISNQ